MIKIALLAGAALLLAACGGGGGSPSEAACNATPVKYGETDYCGYYPGYGWARVPFATSIRQN